MPQFKQFYRQYGVFNSAGFRKIHTHADEYIELPRDSRLHLFDNIYNYGKDYDVSFKMNYPYFNQRRFEVYNVLDTSNGVLAKNNKLMFPTQNLTLKILEFKNDNRKRFNVIIDPSKIDTIDSMRLVVFNYNPLFRVKLIGRYIEQRLVEMILSEVVNKTYKYSGNHFVVIPLETMAFSMPEFTRTYKNFSPINFKYITNIHYIFMVHIMNFFNVTSGNGILSKIPTDVYDNITLVFKVNNKFIYYNLGEVTRLNKKNATFLQLHRHLSELSIAGRVTKEGDEATSDVVVDPDTTIAERHSSILVDVIEDSVELVPKTIDAVSELDDISKIIIDRKKETITPKQYEKLKNTAVEYKAVVFEANTLEAILDTPEKQTTTLKTDTLDYLEDHVADKSMLHSSIATARTQYMDKSFKKDLVGTLTDFSKNGYFLTDIKKVEERNELSRIDYYSVTYVNDKHEQTTIKFHLPHVNADGDILINGMVNRLRFQNINKPICKISKDTVSLSSNNNKSLVHRHDAMATSFNHHMVKHIVKNGGEDVKVVYGLVSTVDNVRLKLPYEYTSLSDLISKIKIKKDTIVFNFDYNIRFEQVSGDDLDFVKKYEIKSKSVYLGGNSATAYFLQIHGNLLTIDVKKQTEIEEAPKTLLDYIYSLIGMPTKPLANWVDLKILNKKFPMIYVLGYRYGLSNVLKHLHIDYTEFPAGTRVVVDQPSDVVIKFLDKSLVFKRVPMAKSLFSNGLRWMELKEYYFEDMDDKSTYLSISLDKKIGINYLKGIDNFFDLFMDFKTKEVLAQMGEPTNMLDLLVRATTMLVDQQHIPPASVENFRTRSYEKFIDVIYNEMSRELGQKKSSGPLNKNKFTINPDIVFQRIMADTLMDNVSIINPIHQIKMESSFSYTGVGGRDPLSFVHKDRQFPDDGVGVMSEATVDSSKVAINACFSQNPNITNNNGLIEPANINTVEPAQMLSVTGLLIPGGTNDDS